ncbi:hypothetical protein M413DRAFT_259032 [Hebeloma cylindrosporum]|uniref:F-box domain-containing protein n=1 Tax=Hebeloma cylindrosporum TaxID=76867 RepID=A0A0C3C064_HEBCY|nr:hypothetical protein M413DRAFT_259032 [Hebeloma cylindrosporum h7]
MSAKEFYYKRPLHLPEIPPEIWITVLRHATGDYELAFPSELRFETIGPPMWYTSERLKRFRKALVTKRNIVLVCKTWYAMACPFLYEHIVLGRNKVLAPLCDGLSRAALENRKVGWWTERLDVRMRDATQTPGATFATLADILAHLPNLCILTFSITGYGFSESPLPNAVLNSITSSGSLKCVQWHNAITTPSSRNWTAFLQKHPELEFLDGKQNIDWNPHIKLDAVKILHGCPLPTRSRAVWSTVDLPAVRSMLYDWPYGSEIDDVITFSRLGDKLTDLQLNFFGGHLRDFRVTALDLLFTRIRAECTRLTQVILVVDSWSILDWYIPTLPTTVHALGIRVMAEQVSASNAKRFFNILLPAYVASNPSLKTIKFMEERNIRALRSHSLSMWNGFRVMQGLGVAVKDLEDRRIVAPNPPLVPYFHPTPTLDGHHTTS